MYIAVSVTSFSLHGNANKPAPEQINDLFAVIYAETAIYMTLAAFFLLDSK